MISCFLTDCSFKSFLVNCQMFQWWITIVKDTGMHALPVSLILVKLAFPVSITPGTTRKVLPYSELIWDPTYLIPIIFDTKLIWYRTSVIPDLFDSKLIWYWANLVPNSFYTELIDTKLIWYRTYMIPNC